MVRGKLDTQVDQGQSSPELPSMPSVNDTPLVNGMPSVNCMPSVNDPGASS